MKICGGEAVVQAQRAGVRYCGLPTRKTALKM